MSALCVHLYVIDKTFSPELLAEKKESLCTWCQSKGPNLWLCLYRGCLKVGCAEGEFNHSLVHNNDFSSHCIAINLSNLKSWCYMCEMEVTNWVLCKLSVSPSQQPHFGCQISSPGVAIARPVTPNESSAEEEVEENKIPQNQDIKPRGLVGLRNLGLTCYMNAALQALSNSLPLCQFLKDCPSFLHSERKQPGIVRPFHKLILDMWHPKSVSHIAPSLVYHSFRTLYPMFRPYTQQDSQEFLRYFMDQLHEELREQHLPLNNEDEDKEDEDDGELSSIENLSERGGRGGGESECSSSPSEGEDYETCDSGLSDRTLSSSSSEKSNPSLHHKAKRKKRHHTLLYDTNKWVHYNGVRSKDQDQSEFSDAMSDTSLLDSKSAKPHSEPNNNNNTLKVANSSSTSGLGSSKPSMSSIASCVGKSATSLHSKPPAQLPRSGKGGRLGSISKSTMKSPTTTATARKKKQTRFRSVISDCFDGVLVSSVQCLTCNTTSSRKETFQDLSLPIPSSDQLTLLHQHSPQQQQQQQQKSHNAISTSQNSSFNIYLSKNACDVTGDGWMWLWIWSIWGWVRSWLWGPGVSLSNCLAAFFSADELKGDNMYSCEKCGKLRNGVKYSKVIQLPEILIIHLKRFRHEYMFSSKISQYVSFPLHGLDLSPFLHKDCSSEVRTYDLYSVICHHGAVGSGHYTAYGQNAANNRWYEFDDQCVTEVSLETVANCEAYVLFYKKVGSEMSSRRQRTVELMQVSSHEPSLMQFHVSKQWINKFNTFAEPGPIDNADFLCPHGGVQPSKASYVGDLVMVFNQGVWEYLHQVFGGGPACTSLYECVTCREEQDALLRRQKLEHETFIHLHSLFQDEEQPDVVYAISMRWFRTWEAFVVGRQSEPPGPLDNSSICSNKHGQLVLKPGSDYAPISKEMWTFFFETYGGGPELFVRYGRPQSSPQRTVRSESYDDTMYSTDEMRQRRQSDAHLMPFGLKSLSTDDLPLCVTFNQQDRRGSFVRQRTVSASEIIPSFSESSLTFPRERRSYPTSSDEEEERRAMQWTERERGNEDEERGGGERREEERGGGGEIREEEEEVVPKVQPSISRPHTRSFTKSFN